MKLEEQAQKYLDNNGNLEAYSLGRICISTKLKIEVALQFLRCWDNNLLINGNKSPIQLIVNEIVKLAPSYIYQILTENEGLILKYMTYEFQTITGIHCNGDMGMMLRSLNELSSKIILVDISTYVMVINNTFILAYLHLLRKNYHNAIMHFEWLTNVFNTKIKNLGFVKENTKSSGFASKSVVTVLLLRCYDFGKIDINENRYREMQTSFALATKYHAESEYLSGRLSHYFFSLGLLHEKESMKQASIVVINSNHHKVESHVFKLEPNNLEKMIKMYILAATNKAQDDPTTSILYDRIIWGILLCGGIHLKCLWFFNIIKYYFLVEANYGPLHIFHELNFKMSNNDNILNHYENSQMLIDYFKKIFNDIPSGNETNNIWNVENGTKYLIPQIFDAGNKLLIQNTYDEINQTNNCHMLNSPYRAKQDFEGNIKLEDKQISNRMELSRDFIVLWYKTYNQKHGSVPKFIKNLVADDWVLSME